MTETIKNPLTKPPVVILMTTLCCLLWGSAFPCIKLGSDWCAVGDDAASKILFAGTRFTLAGIMTVIICSIIRRRALIPASGRTVKKILILCMFQTVLQYIFFYIGLLNTSGVKASVIEGANVFVAIIIVCFVLRLEKLTAAKIAGCIVGFAGVVTINLTGSGFDPSMKFTGEGFILISTVAYAFSSALLKKFGTDEDPLLLSGWQFFAGGLIMTAAGAAFGGSFSLPSGKAAAMLVYLAFISAAAYSMWAMLLRYNDVSRIAVFGFMNPVFGVILSALLLDEGESAFSAKACVSLLLVCAGIYIVNKKTKEVLTDEYSG